MKEIETLTLWINSIEREHLSMLSVKVSEIINELATRLDTRSAEFRQSIKTDLDYREFTADYSDIIEDIGVFVEYRQRILDYLDKSLKLHSIQGFSESSDK